jgi:hypothetical protein
MERGAVTIEPWAIEWLERQEAQRTAHAVWREQNRLGVIALQQSLIQACADDARREAERLGKRVKQLAHAG